MLGSPLNLQARDVTIGVMATTPAPTTVLLCDDCGEPSTHTICDQCESWRDHKHGYEDDEPMSRFNLWSEP